MTLVREDEYGYEALLLIHADTNGIAARYASDLAHRISQSCAASSGVAVTTIGGFPDRAAVMLCSSNPKALSDAIAIAEASAHDLDALHPSIARVWHNWADTQTPAAQ